MNEFELSYALAKQVPDMRGRGFVIGTSYGDMTIPPGPLAERLSDHVRLVLALELARLRMEAEQKTALSAALRVAGPDWFDRTLMGRAQS